LSGGIRTSVSTTSGRYDPRLLLAWYYGLRGLSLLALPAAFDSPHFGLILFVIFYGLDWVATVPPTVALTAEIFGPERVGVVFGWIFAAHMFGASAAAWAAGAVRDSFGGYGWAFGTSGLLCLFAVGLVVQITREAEPLPVLATA
jgi:MFS family permease